MAAPVGPKSSPFSKAGVCARVFAERFAGRLRYCHHTGGWFRWSGMHWQRDETDVAFQYARRLGREASDGARDAVLKEVRKVAFAAGVERFARGDEALAVTAEAWDGDPFLLGTPGGTVDLRPRPGGGAIAEIVLRAA